MVENLCLVPQSTTLPVAAPQDQIVDVPGAMPRQTPTTRRHTTPGADDPERAEECGGIADPVR